MGKNNLGISIILMALLFNSTANAGIDVSAKNDEVKQGSSTLSILHKGDQVMADRIMALVDQVDTEIKVGNIENELLPEEEGRVIASYISLFFFSQFNKPLLKKKKIPSFLLSKNFVGGVISSASFPGEVEERSPELLTYLISKQEKSFLFVFTDEPNEEYRDWYLASPQVLRKIHSINSNVLDHVLILEVGDELTPLQKIVLKEAFGSKDVFKVKLTNQKNIFSLFPGESSLLE